MSTRRGFFGISFGAAAAGPDIVKEAANEVLMYKGAPVMLDKKFPNLSEIGQSATYSPEELAAKKAQELAQIRKIISGDVENEMAASADVNYSPEPYKSLKSVSKEARAFMLQRKAYNDRRSEIIERAKKALAEYDKTGLLRNFWY